MVRKSTSRACVAALCLILCTILSLGALDALVPDRLSLDEGEALPTFAGVSLEKCAEDEATAKLFGILPLKQVSLSVKRDLSLYPGGMVFGVELHTDGVLVVGLSEVTSGGRSFRPAASAGLRVGDVIRSINEGDVSTVTDVTDAIAASEGRAMRVVYTRDGEEHTCNLTPLSSDADAAYRAGLWVRDSSAGIGTVSFIDPAGGVFGGLGHAICDTDTGKAIPIARGAVAGVSLIGVKRGTVGSPGELRGYFTADRLGAVVDNTDCGVFGVLTEIPDSVPEGPLPVASRDEVREGDAYIWCTTADGAPHKYAVRISGVDRNSETRSFRVTVTSEELRALTGGIVQGMSGSPIVQDGKLVGAVTHVLINDPTSGYGIFIENMLEKMSIPIG